MIGAGKKGGIVATTVRLARGPISTEAGLVALLGLAILLNYIDRGAIAIASPVLKPELGLSNTDYGTFPASSCRSRRG